MKRTTVTIDDDVAVLIEERQRREGLSLEQVVHALLHKGLPSGRQAPRAKKYRTKPHRLRLRTGFDSVKLNQAADRLENPLT